MDRDQLAQIKARQFLLIAEANRVRAKPCPECGYGGAPFYAWGHRNEQCATGQAVLNAQREQAADMMHLIAFAEGALS